MKVAFVGAGSMAREHLRAFRAIPGVELAGIFSRTLSRAEGLAAEFGLPLVAQSVDELYQESRAGLVVVSVPELSANEVAKACFGHDWVVMLEKPAGYNIADASDISESAANRGRRAFVALNRRFYAATRDAAARLSADPGPRFVRIQDQQDQAAALAAGQPESVVRNWMYANSIHVIDYMRVFCRGRIVDVSPVVRWNANAPGLVVARISFDSGDVALYEGIWNGPGPWAVTVSTPSQRLEMRPLEVLGVQRRGERRLEVQPASPLDTDFKAGFRLQAEMAVAAAMGKASELPTLEDGLESMRLVRQIFELQE